MEKPTRQKKGHKINYAIQNNNEIANVPNKEILIPATVITALKLLY